jgi:hypothetical protein
MRDSAIDRYITGNWGEDQFRNCPEPSQLEEDVLGLLEAAGMSLAVSDSIMKLISDWQHKREMEEIAKEDAAMAGSGEDWPR